MNTSMAEAAQESAHKFKETFTSLQSAIGEFIVGQEDIVENVLISIICGGHVLLEGVPGLGKTALVQTIANALELQFKRVQFTPDLLPSDILGSNILTENEEGRKVFEFQHGPIFCNLLLADEINRATPKTQSALLETMQEGTVTIAGTTHQLDKPFFVLATQNPIENDGTYPLPEAQLDRFFFKLYVKMPSAEDLGLILERTGSGQRPQVPCVASGADILSMGETIRQVPIEKSVRDSLIKIVSATHPDHELATEQVKQYVRSGASPRGAQTMLAAAQAKALLSGRFHVSTEDIAAIALPALTHRILLSFEGEAEGVTASSVVQSVVDAML